MNESIVLPAPKTLLREFADHARRTAAAPDIELADHLELLERALSATRELLERAKGNEHRSRADR